MSESHGLNPRQERFLASILKGKSATQSALDAGYAERSAHTTGARMLKNPIIQAKIRGTLEKNGWSADRVLQEMEDLFKQAKQAESWTACTKILELLGRHAGLFTERKEVEHKHSHSFEALLDKAQQAPIDVTPRAKQLQGVPISQETETKPTE